MRINLSCLQASRIRGISVSGKRLSRKSDNVVVFPFAFHITVQQLFKPLWSRLLLYELERVGGNLANQSSEKGRRIWLLLSQWECI
jgi:hypothetical protein